MSVYETFGPFLLERDGNKFRKSAFAEFWKRVTDLHSGLSAASGVYIVAIKAKNNSPLKPWYVGKTDRQGYKRRFAQQLGRFGEVLDEAKNGVPYVFLLARRTPTSGAFAKPSTSPSAANDELERRMIASCYSVNRRLTNMQRNVHNRTLIVPGYMNNKPGKLPTAALELSQMIKAGKK